MNDHPLSPLQVRKQIFDRTWCAVLSVVSPQSMGTCQEPSEISVGEGQGEADEVRNNSSIDANSETLIKNPLIRGNGGGA